MGLGLGRLVPKQFHVLNLASILAKRKSCIFHGALRFLFNLIYINI
jgi:hypothetical protein